MHCTVKKDSFNFCERKTARRVTTKIENNTLKVVCTISAYGHMLPDKKVKDDEIILIGEIHMVFKRGEPWAASVRTEAED